MPAVLAIFNEPIMSWFSPPGLAGTPYAHEVGWKQSKYNQAPCDDATAQLETEKNCSQNAQCGFREVKKPAAGTET